MKDQRWKTMVVEGRGGEGCKLLLFPRFCDFVVLT